MSSETGLEDLSLIDLFRSEVETHSESLSAALLALERTPSDTSRIDEMMRAAHSIKGAARVVGVDPAVSVAHVMEDCFVAAQKGTIALSPGDVDVLLRGVDLLGKISAATRDPERGSGVTSSAVSSQELVAELQAVLSGRGSPAESRPRVRERPLLRHQQPQLRNRKRPLPPRRCPRRRRRVTSRSHSRKSWIRQPPKRSANSSWPRSTPSARRSDSTCRQPRIWMSRAWRFWLPFRRISPSTAVRRCNWREFPSKWRRCSVSRGWLNRSAFAVTVASERPSERWKLVPMSS